MRVLLVDFKNLAYRAIFNGESGSAPALLNLVNILLGNLSAHHLIFASDGTWPLWRQTYLDPNYKSNRIKVKLSPKARETKELFDREFPVLRRFAMQLGHPFIEVPGLEADDLIGILSERIARAWKWHSYIVSNDRDYYSLLSPHVSVYKPISYLGSGYHEYTLDSFQAEYKLTPDVWPHYKALMGDAGDKVPGLANVGEKRALEAIHAGVRAHMQVSELPAPYNTKWVDRWGAAYMMLQLVWIPRTVFQLPTEYHTITEDALMPLGNYRNAHRCGLNRATRLDNLMSGGHHISTSELKLFQSGVNDLMYTDLS